MTPKDMPRAYNFREVLLAVCIFALAAEPVCAHHSQPSTISKSRMADVRAQFTVRDQKKLAEKDRKLQEKAVQAKAAALADDDDVFDVAYEQQGEPGTTASARDIQGSPAAWHESH